MKTPSTKTPTMETPSIKTPIMGTPSIKTPIMGTPSIKTPIMGTPIIMEASEIKTVSEQKPKRESFFTKFLNFFRGKSRMFYIKLIGGIVAVILIIAVIIYLFLKK
jgi:hypothetical protein